MAMARSRFDDTRHSGGDASAAASLPATNDTGGGGVSVSSVVEVAKVVAAVEEKIDEMERVIYDPEHSALLQRWKDHEAKGNGYVGRTIRNVKRVEGVDERYHNERLNNGKDDLIRRFKSRDHQPYRSGAIGTNMPGATHVPEEPRSVEKDLNRGKLSLDTNPLENKWKEDWQGDSGKTNYVLAYKQFNKGQIGAITSTEKRDGARLGFNVGQTEGGDYWKTNYGYNTLEESDNRLDRQMLAAFLNVALQHSPIRDDRSQKRKKQKVYDDLWPGVTRLPINFNFQVSLNSLLEQNQLLPSGGRFDSDRIIDLKGKERRLFGFGTGSTDIQNVWNKMWGKSENERDPERLRGVDDDYPRGHVSRQGVEEIQEPRRNPLNGKIIDGTGAINITGGLGDAKYNNYVTRHRGFYSNILGNVRTSPANLKAPQEMSIEEDADNPASGGGLLPAVEHRPKSITNDKWKWNDDSLDSSLGQYFPFMFETANRSTDINGVPKIGVYEQYAYFQATLAQLSEQFTPDWQSTHFSGRTEDVYTYAKSGRAIDIRFVVFANSARELQNVYERTNWLAQQTYPLYDRNPSKVSGGPIIRITIGDLLQRVSGFIRSLSFNWDFLGANKWEIQPGLRMPMACEVSMSFQVIHEYTANRDSDFYQGLSNNMLVGGRRNFTKSGYTLANRENDGRVALKVDRAAWANSSNLIPTKNATGTKGGDDGHVENFVTLLARNRLVNDTGGDVTAKLGFGRGRTNNRLYAPGEIPTYSDLIELAGGEEQIGEDRDFGLRGR